MSLSFKKEVAGELEEVVNRVTQALASQGFGVLSRIDFHLKMKEKLNKDLKPVVILGACNPQIAFDAYSVSTDVTALLPCNAVVREVGAKRYSVELVKPSALLQVLGQPELTLAAKAADEMLLRAQQLI